MDEIIIRQEKEKDFNQIQEVVRLAFLQMEESDHTEHNLVERLHQSDAFIPELSLVAETADKKIEIRDFIGIDCSCVIAKIFSFRLV